MNKVSMLLISNCDTELFNWEAEIEILPLSNIGGKISTESNLPGFVWYFSISSSIQDI